VMWWSLTGLMSWKSGSELPFTCKLAFSKYVDSKSFESEPKNRSKPPLVGLEDARLKSLARRLFSNSSTELRTLRGTKAGFFKSRFPVKNQN
jgi:hypothetical protein